MSKIGRFQSLNTSNVELVALLKAHFICQDKLSETLHFLGVSAWGVTQLREGLERRKLSRYDSYSVTYYDTDDKYFREYPYRVNVSIVL